VDNPKFYAGVDLKSFYASAEVESRHLDPLRTNLVVADPSRTDKTICLAVSPSLKAHGISGRARLFEVVQRVKEVNAERFRRAMKLGVLPKDEKGRYHFTSTSFDADALEEDPSLELGYIIAPPRMRMYEEISSRIVSVYQKFVAPEDLIVYSIDEVFIHLSPYLESYHLSPRELVTQMIREVLYTTGITATAGIGTNLYLAKVAMDIVAKHVPADKDGVRIAELDEMSYRDLLWCHKPLTDFWRVGPGIARRLESLGCYTMGDVARLSEKDENRLYSTLGINAELVIDHAWGWEPLDIKTIKSYKPQSNSLSSGQVLMEPYSWEKAKLITREMTELLVLDLVQKGLVTKKIELTISYDKTSIEYLHRAPSIKDSTFKIAGTNIRYTGLVGADHFGRPCPKYAHGTGNLDHYTSSMMAILDCMMELYDRIVDKELTIRRVNIVAVKLIPESEVPEEVPEQLDLFTDYEALDKQRAEAKMKEDRERKLLKTTLMIQAKYGKNAMLKGMNFMDGATTRQRNAQIGGHRAGDDERLSKSRAVIQNEEDWEEI
jgi:DNA polymerase V